MSRAPRLLIYSHPRVVLIYSHALSLSRLSPSPLSPRVSPSPLSSGSCPAVAAGSQGWRLPRPPSSRFGGRGGVGLPRPVAARRRRQRPRPPLTCKSSTTAILATLKGKKEATQGPRHRRIILNAAVVRGYCSGSEDVEGITV
uniref:Uncharacterized protein n=1 Tax=Oryza nivara TaxID=4536 RepID=A0A0E0J8Z2_ORYNI